MRQSIIGMRKILDRIGQLEWISGKCILSDSNNVLRIGGDTIWVKEKHLREEWLFYYHL